MSNELQVHQRQNAMQSYVFDCITSFEAAQRMAKPLSESSMVPKDYKGNLPNCIVALELSQRVRASVFMVMQNLDVIHGRPSWRSQFIIAAINSCGRFKPLRYHLVEDKERKDFSYDIFETEWKGKDKVTKVIKKTNNILNKTCIAWTLETGVDIPNEVFSYIKEQTLKNNTVALLDACKRFGVPVMEGPEISIEMACKEGWYDKSGSKWQSMPGQMVRYRAAAFFGRLHVPDILMGMYTVEEVEDFGMKDVTPVDNKGLKQAILDKEAASTTQAEPTALDILLDDQKPIKAENLAEGEVEEAHIWLSMPDGTTKVYPDQISTNQLISEFQRMTPQHRDSFKGRNKKYFAQMTKIAKEAGTEGAATQFEQWAAE